MARRRAAGDDESMRPGMTWVLLRSFIVGLDSTGLKSLNDPRPGSSTTRVAFLRGINTSDNQLGGEAQVNWDMNLLLPQAKKGFSEFFWQCVL